MKKELTYVPLFGWAQHLYGMIAVNRAAGGATLKKLLHDAKDRIQQGTAAVFSVRRDGRGHRLPVRDRGQKVIAVRRLPLLGRGRTYGQGI